MHHFSVISKVRHWMFLALICAWAGDAAADIHYRFVTVDGSKIFYREAGDESKPTILLLHGFPSSSHMFRDLIPELATSFHVVAPDYPGMGNSDAAPAGTKPVTFDSVADSMNHFIHQIGVKEAVIYMQDFGGPVGMRMATLHPELVKGLIFQNTPITLDGWEPSRLKAVQTSVELQPRERRAVSEARVVPATDLLLYKHGARDPDALNPDAWTNDAVALADAEKRRVMTDLQVDIPSNITLYPQWKAYLQKALPRTLVVWGDGDPIFAPRGADAIKDFLPDAQVFHYNSGHFALEEEHRDIAQRIVAVFGQP